MENKQLTHFEFKKTQKEFGNNIIFILENLEHSENIGSAFRLADAFNIEEVIIVNNGELSFEKIRKTARSSEKIVKYQIVDNIDSAIDIALNKNYTPFALEITSKSKPLREYDFSNYFGIALIVGNEKHGVKEETLLKIKNTIHIDMYGTNSSMNVASVLAIATYKISEDYYSINK